MNQCNRKIVLDTETTGMNSTGCFYKNHKIIEIGAVEIIDGNFTGNDFHSYIQPNRPIDRKSFEIHGISDNFLLKKPEFRDIAKKFLTYINNSTLIIHNSKFDVGFINYELSMLNLKVPKISKYCNIVDTLSLARKLFPGKKNSLDALCNRYKINIRDRHVHSALYDAQILAKVYMFMTNLQQSITVFNQNKTFNDYQKNKNEINKISLNSTVLLATQYEINQHEKYLKYMEKKTGKCLWLGK